MSRWIAGASIAGALIAVAACTPTSIYRPVSVNPPAAAPDAAPPAPTTPTAPTAPAVDPRVPDWSHPPAPGAEPAWSPPRPTAFTLASGVRVLLVENHRLPLISIRVIEHRAGAREDGARPGTAALTAALLDQAAGAWTSTTLPEQVERLGAALDTSIAADDATISIDTLRDSLEPSIALVADVAMRPRFPAADVARVKGERLAELRRRPDEPRLVAALVFERLVFGAHPYAQPADGYVATVAPLGAGELRAFWQAHYGPRATTIVVAGDVDRATLEPLLAAAFGAWTGGPDAAPPPAPPAPVSHPPILAFVDRPGAPQSVVVIGRLGAAADDPDYPAREVVNTALGGSFSSRLNTSLREVHGWTYGAASGFWRGRWAGSWELATSLKTEDTVVGVVEAIKIVDDTRAHPLAADELDRTQRLMTRSLPQDFETNAGIASAFERVVTLGLPDDWYQTWGARVRAVTADAARAAADAAWSDLTIVVVGDWRVVGQGLAALGVPIVRLDAEGNPLPARPARSHAP